MPNKYKAKRIEADGIWFDSRKEHKRYLALKALEEVGAISNLQCHQSFELIPTQRTPDGRAVRKAEYTADFTYMQNGELVVEDVKSPPTRKKADYVLRKKLMLWRHGIWLKEI